VGEALLQRDRRVARVARTLLLALAVLWSALAVSTVPGVRPAPGFLPLWDGWVQCTGYVLAAAIAALRPALRTEHRLLWSLVATALGLRAFAFVWSITVLGQQPPYPSLADAAWLVSGLLVVVALWLLARTHLPRLSRTLALDAVLGGVTAAALASALLYPTLVALTVPDIPPEAVVTNLVYPLIDVAQLTLIAGLLATRWRLAPAALSVSAGTVALALVDCVFLYLSATGQFRPGTVLAPLSLGGTALIALGAWLPATGRRGPRHEDAAGLVVPAALAMVCVGVLAYDATHTVPLLGTAFAAVGVVVALVRGWTTLTLDRRAASADLDAKQRELERFQSLVAASSDFIGIADTSGRLLYLNPGGRRLVGLAPDADISATRVDHYLSPEALAVWIEERLPVVLAEGHWEGESSLRDQRGGPPIPVVASTFRLSDPDSGKPWLVATIQRDISDRKDAEQALRRFSSLVEASSDFIAIAGVDGRVQYVNPAGRAMVGLAPDADVTVTTIADYLTAEGIRASIEVEQPAVVAEGHWEGESTLRDLRGGPPTPVAINSFLIRHPDTGEPWLMATVQRDITERLAAEREVQLLADQRQVLLGHLVQAQEDERARIAADVHDDSVQALAAVELRLSLLHRELARTQPELLPQVETLRGTVRGATDRLRHLLFDLESPAQRGDLTDALAEAAAYVLEDAVRWSVEGDGGRALPEATRVTAYRVAKEAIVNARKHARAHRVVIEVHDRDGGVEVSVVDDGRGFDTTRAEDRPGHLGLPGMRDRAAVAGGTVEVASTPGEGTSVRVWLPDGVAPVA
jgi:PAS domain S-box-containing protein